MDATIFIRTALTRPFGPLFVSWNSAIIQRANVIVRVNGGRERDKKNKIDAVIPVD